MDLWLPLTQDTRQQGLSNASVTAVGSGASINANGKLGKCYYLDGTSNGYITTDFPTNFGTNDFTISLWVKIPTISSGSYYTIVSSKQSPAISVGVGIYWNYSQKRFLWSTADGTNATEIWMADAVDTIVYDKWIHLVMVRDNNDSKKGCFYINGTRYELASVPVIRNITTATNLWVGKISSGNYPCKLYISDIRVWNDCALAPKEIEILSRGLVAHYPLDNNGSGQPNLYDFESVANKWAVEGLTLANATDEVYGNVLKITSPSSVSSQRIYRTVSNVWKADTKFTVSFLAKASKTAVVKMSRSLANYAPDVTVGTAWKRYSTVITCSTTVEGGTLSIQTSTASADIYITQIKLELGDKATAYQPGVGDSHYVPLGYDSTTIYDCSGYQNNATPWAYDSTGSIDITTDTPRYSTSTFINSANPTSGEAAGTRYIYGNCTLVKPEKLTLTFWCKPIKGYGNTTSHGIFSLTNYDIGQYAAVDYQEAPLNHRDGGFDVNGISGSTYTHKRLTVTFTTNEWHHYVITYDGRYAKLYKDGVQSTSADMGATMPLGSMKGIVVGFSKAGGVWRHVQSYYSDVRLYATALSATQVAELYNTAVSVANNGTLMGYELVEG